MKYISYVLSFFLLTSCASTGTINNQTRIDNIPMYGQPEIKRPDFLIQADKDFISKVEKGFGSREKASQAWYTQGGKFMRDRNLDFAMRRYNQSWLLNPNNYQPYWGFSRVLLEQGKVDEAIKYLEKSESLINDPYQEVALLSDLGVTYTRKAKQDPSYFSKANNSFIKSTQMDPKYPSSWLSWAYSLYEQQKYSECWDKIEKYKALTSKPFPLELIEALNKKLPKP